MARPAKLPIGIQAFETIRENGYLYVDKTRHVFRMIDEGMFYFLARPRRFGKSLLVSTLKCLFQGRRELFRGLWIGEHADWDWKPYPIILMDFNGITHDTPENLKLDLERTLAKTAATHGVEITEPLYTLNYPNQEVRHAFLENLFRSLVKDGRSDESSKFALLTGYLEREDFDAFFETTIAIFASIPYSLESKRDEAYFHTLFYLMVSASEMDARSEMLTCRGRIDLAVIFPDKVFLMEFKCDQDAETGIQQIRNRGYAEPYLRSGKKVYFMGIDFSSQKRNLAEWKVEEAVP